jgi:hypothetical protein
MLESSWPRQQLEGMWGWGEVVISMERGVKMNPLRDYLDEAREAGALTFLARISTC